MSRNRPKSQVTVEGSRVTIALPEDCEVFDIINGSKAVTIRVRKRKERNVLADSEVSYDGFEAVRR